MSVEEIARSFLREFSSAVDRRRRARLVFRFLEKEAPAPTVYFLVPDYNIPAGGNRVIYRHVDILNGAGIKTFALHERRGFRFSWFENNTPVTNLAATKIARNDVLVVSELNVDLLGRLP